MELASIEEVETSWGELEMSWAATGTDGAPNLQQVAAERLAAHRRKRATVAAQEAEHEAHARRVRESVRQAKREDQRRGASAVRDTVKARYERRESYREFLAAEAERAIQQAQAEAEVAQRSAHAVVEAQMRLLEEFDSANRPEPGPREVVLAQHAAEARGELAHALADIVLGARELMAEPAPLSIVASPAVVETCPEADVPAEPPTREISAAGLTVRLFETLTPASPRPTATSALKGLAPRGFTGVPPEAEPVEQLHALEHALEEEIAFRQAPEFSDYVALEAAPIHGNLIEFPRELVAPRRARPRLAEGPLRDEVEPQLRIFEVDAVQEVTAPAVVDLQSIPDWQSGVLESAMVEPWQNPYQAPVAAQTQLTLAPHTAPVERRLMSAVVDGSLILGGWLVAVAAAAQIAGPVLGALSLPLLAAAAAGSLALFAVLFQLLFFTLSDSTPGMRWARIGLCTFGDSNPSRRAMRRRIVSSLLAACPLGLGLAWVFMDNDRLGWHDRMSRMYQRAY